MHVQERDADIKHEIPEAHIFYRITGVVLVLSSGSFRSMVDVNSNWSKRLSFRFFVLRYGTLKIDIKY